MIFEATIAVVVSVGVLAALILLTTAERQAGRRFFAKGVRGWLDGVVARSGASLRLVWEHFSKYIVQLNWYYSIHAALRTMLRTLVSLYTMLEQIFERNRARTKRLRAERRRVGQKTHLQLVSDHKRDTTLSPEAQKDLRTKKLEDGD